MKACKEDSLPSLSTICVVIIVDCIMNVCVIFGCVDVDECAVSNGGCEETCTNTDSSFSCSCSTGYVLASNGLDCNGK